MDDTEVRLRIEIELRDKIGRMSAKIERLRSDNEQLMIELKHVAGNELLEIKRLRAALAALLRTPRLPQVARECINYALQPKEGEK